MALKGEIVMRIADWPEAMARIRREMAQALRGVADAEPSTYVRGRMHAVADAFECGQRAEGRHDG